MNTENALPRERAEDCVDYAIRAIRSHQALIDALEKIASTYKPAGATHEETARDMREQARAALLSC